MEGPPSFTSAIARNSDQQHSQDIEPKYYFEQNHYTPSMSEIRSLADKSHPDLSFDGGSDPRAIVQPSETYDAGGQPISIGAMAVRGSESWYPQLPDDTSGYGEQAPSIGSMARDGGNSQTAGGNFNYNPPPSYKDVASRDPSYTGESDGGLNLPDGNYEGVSLNGRDFAKLFPKMFQNDDEFNPYRV